MQVGLWHRAYNCTGTSDKLHDQVTLQVNRQHADPVWQQLVQKSSSTINKTNVSSLLDSAGKLHSVMPTVVRPIFDC